MGATCCSHDGKGDVIEPLPDREPLHSSAKQICRPLRIILIRHGHSEGNETRSITKEVPDHMLHLTAKGREQATEAGKMLKEIVGEQSVLFVTSPYVRAVETFHGIAYSFGGKDKVDSMEEINIREQDFGNFDKENMSQFHKEKKKFGKFYYRFPEGESPADMFQRAGLFLESLYRRWETHYTDNLIIVSHELFITVFLMRLFRWPVQDFYEFEDMSNCQLTVLERPADKSRFEPSYIWNIGEEKQPGCLKRKAQAPPEVEVWDGDPDSALLKSKS
eukprot:TRINITY_DN73010_c0_g1_i1.p1 TRINITY_DN73010_c0_g1~~TRINITY_DN73010_c0_g1_i1.p1  ORF type:complete len:276 (-),score=40.84 TRINITY_DN73010_c0_g1_i1:56-883(-)